MDDVKTESITVPLVSIIMGSESDLKIMKMAAFVMEQYDIPYEIKVVSAHRTPERMYEYARNAQSRNVEVIIAGAGGSAHLPGMVASITSLPVIGVPIKSSNSVDGWDSILSILQMPAGVPVATVALNGAKNAGILAAQMIGNHDAAVSKAVEAYKLQIGTEVLDKADKLKANWPNQFDQQ